ncbi:unnamed protein product [Blepharisma stoltei]|uniref:LAGLIDADG homing endonuclease n=1 Tax=Blepharisma stoltei TaxID=1481888 RepID=A0AAU9IWM6_9CILI|nr:unnamed protein product [Blepharisma stoltei]
MKKYCESDIKILITINKYCRSSLLYCLLECHTNKAWTLYPNLSKGLKINPTKIWKLKLSGSCWFIPEKAKKSKQNSPYCLLFKRLVPHETQMTTEERPLQKKREKIYAIIAAYIGLYGAARNDIKIIGNKCNNILKVSIEKTFKIWKIRA